MMMNFISWLLRWEMALSIDLFCYHSWNVTCSSKDQKKYLINYQKCIESNISYVTVFHCQYLSLIISTLERIFSIDFYLTYSKKKNQVESNLIIKRNSPDLYHNLSNKFLQNYLLFFWLISSLSIIGIGLGSHDFCSLIARTINSYRWLTERKRFIK